MLTEWGQKLVSLSNRQIDYYGDNIPPQLQYAKRSAANILVKDVNGDSFYIPPRAASSDTDYYLRYSWSTTPSDGIYIGSDNTLPTKNDYTLGSIITGLLSSNIKPTIDYVYNENTDLYSVFLDYSISNATNNSVTIREIGFIRQFYTSTTKGANASGSTKAILIDRTVLDAPLEIPAGEARVLRYEFIYG